MAIAVLGADMLLAGLPATPVQIAHACLAAGYHVAVPASWGDELLAAECLRQLTDRGPRPAVMCSCPYVRSELLAVGPDLAPVLVPLVAPPVAAARYLHALYGRERIHVTYIGSCPGAEHEDIDASMSPGEFLARLDEAGIDLAGQPRVFDSVIPPDRRRFFSVAGGVPSAEQLWSIGNGRSLVELDGEDYLIDLAQHLLSHESALIDLAPRLGCACSGASATIPARSARAAVAVVEPPRAASTVIDVSIGVDVTSPIDVTVGAEPSGTAGASDAGMAETGSSLQNAVGPLQGSGEGASSKRHRGSPGVRTRPMPPPMARVAGRALPRAYVARRRADPHRDVPPAEDQPPARIPSGSVIEPVGDELGRSRQPARVAASARHDDRGSGASIAAGAAGAPDKMSDGPRT